MSKQFAVVKVNTANRNAVLIKIDHKPEALMKLVGDRRLGGRDMQLDDGNPILLRLVCNTEPPEEAVRWTFAGSGFENMQGWIRGNAAFVGYDPRLAAAGQPGVVSCPVDAKFILERIRWFDPNVDSVGPVDA